MTLSDLINAVRIELQDTTRAIYSDDEITRSINKAISLMSRLLPYKSIVEFALGDDVTGETLVISSSTGTTAYKPIKPYTETITGKTRDVDYSIDYLTGIVTEIGALLPDASYTIGYELDRTLININTHVPDCIRISKIEYEQGVFPPYEIIGDYLHVKSGVSFDANKKIRAYYLRRFDVPTYLAEGEYGTHLDEVVMTGAVGNALYDKADYYTQQAVAGLTSIQSALTTLAALTLTLPAAVTPPDAPTAGVAPTPPSMDTLPDAPTLGAAPTYAGGDAPTAPVLSFTDVEGALDDAAAEIVKANASITTGKTLVNTVTAGENVGAIYGQYAGVDVQTAGIYINTALAYLQEIEAELNAYTGELNGYAAVVSVYASEVAAYGNLATAETNVYTATVRGVTDAFTSEVNKYQADIQSYIGKYNAEIDKYNRIFSSLIANNQMLTNAVISEFNGKISQQAAIISGFSDVATQFLAVAEKLRVKGSALLNQFFSMIGNKVEAQPLSFSESGFTPTTE